MLGLYMMALGILYPVGAIAQGWIANAVGIRAVTVAGAVLLFAAVLVYFRPRVLGGVDPAGEVLVQSEPADLVPSATPESQ